VPAPTPVAVIDVALLRSLFARFANPGRAPASMMYEVGDPVAALHAKLTTPPALNVKASPVGAAGVTQGPAPPTVRMASLDGALLPLAFTALTRR
jgi:hypothetical protein